MQRLADRLMDALMVLSFVLFWASVGAIFGGLLWGLWASDLLGVKIALTGMLGAVVGALGWEFSY